MKKNVFIFICISLILLSVIPGINLISGNLPVKWWQWSSLYNVDFGIAYLSRLLYPYGISTNPEQVIIGKNNWLYLGDQYQSTISVTRRGATAADLDSNTKIAQANKAWDQWFKLHGVRGYTIMLAPNKDSIYPEFLPNWAQPAANSVTNNLLAAIGKEIALDMRPVLTAAKSQYSATMFYPTDTHWNSLGAYLALKAYVNKLQIDDPKLQWLNDQQVRVIETNDRHLGDLAKFLRLQAELPDHEVVIDLATPQPVETEHYDFASGQLLAAGGNPSFHAPNSARLVKSKHALNQRRILWLRDSFGNHITPYMPAIFSECLHIHYNSADPATLASLVKTFKPDYVLLTVAERNSTSNWFSNLPPNA